MQRNRCCIDAGSQVEPEAIPEYYDSARPCCCVCACCEDAHAQGVTQASHTTPHPMVSHAPTKILRRALDKQQAEHTVRPASSRTSS